MKNNAKNREALTQSIKAKLKSGELKISMGDCSTINKYPHLKKYFVENVFRDPVLFTDESKLKDFPLYLDGVTLNILDDFKVDIRPVINDTIKVIFEHIESKPVSSITAEEFASTIGLTRSTK